MKHPASLVCLLAAATLAPAASASIVLHYQEDWATASTASMASFGWSAYHTASATDGSNNTVTSGSAAFVASSVGSTGATGIGAKGTGAGGIGLVFTSEFAPVDSAELHSVSFATRNNGDVAGNFQRVALRIDGAWYVTNQTYGNAAGASAWTSHEFLFTTDASAWRAVTFVPGSTLSVAASALAAPLPSGQVSAAGLLLFNTGSNNVLRYDTFAINVAPAPVPEPSAFAALAGLGALGVVAMRRRRRG